MDTEREGMFWDVLAGRVPPPGRVVRRGRQIGFLADELTDEAGTLLATATATVQIQRR
jgi:acyl-coenzyme A thioesterase PaaI-like protein